MSKHWRRTAGLLAAVLLVACSSPPPPGPSPAAVRSVTPPDVEYAVARAIAERGLPAPSPELDAVVALVRSAGPAQGLAPLLASAETPPTSRLRPGDEVQVLVDGQERFSGALTLAQDGSITVVLLGRVEAQGLTTAELEAVLVQRLRGSFVQRPEVVVRLLRRAPRAVRVRGRVVANVRKQSDLVQVAVPEVRGLSLYEAIVQAEGLAPDADAGRLTLVRTSVAPVSSADVAPATSRGCFHFGYDELLAAHLRAQEVWLEPDDELVVPRLATVDVRGAVKQPGRYVLRPGSTVASALLDAGGLVEADHDAIVVVGAAGDERVPLDRPLSAPTVLYAPPARRVYAVGDGVVRRGPVTMPPGGLNVIEALAAAGWVSFSAALGEVEIRRPTVGGERRIVVPVDDILDGDRRADEFPLEPGDTIYVPESGW